MKKQLGLAVMLASLACALPAAGQTPRALKRVVIVNPAAVHAPSIASSSFTPAAPKLLRGSSVQNFVQNEETFYSTIISAPFARFSRGRLRLEGFYGRQSNADLLRGAPETNEVRWAVPGIMAPADTNSFGLRLTLRPGFHHGAAEAD
jgi:hypothetical protein